MQKMTILPALAPCVDPPLCAASRKALEVLERRWLGKGCCVGLLFSVAAYSCGAETASSLAGVRVFLALELKCNNIMDQSHY